MKKNEKNAFRLAVFASLLIVSVVLLSLLFYKKDVVMCDAVNVYLSWADFQWVGQEVKKWDEIVVDYIWRLDDWSVFDTSVESVAKWCDKYNENRSYEEWLSFVVWAGQMIAWFDMWVEWMKIGQTKTIEIAPEDAYWDWEESNLIEAEKSKLDNSDQYKEWDVLYAPNWQAVKVYKVTKNSVFFDTNHELAGKKLIFDITIKEIK